MKTRILLLIFGVCMLLTACNVSSKTAACDSKDCFITKANNCEDMTMDVTEDFGTVNYSSHACTFTKTVLSTNGTEETNKLLTGKSLTCNYEKDKFDTRWVNSIVFGIEYCQGELKDRIVDLMAFLNLE